MQSVVVSQFEFSADGGAPPHHRLTAPQRTAHLASRKWEGRPAGFYARRGGENVEELRRSPLGCASWPLI